MAGKERSHLCHLFPMVFDKVSTVWLSKIAHLYPYIVDLYVAQLIFPSSHLHWHAVMRS